MIDGCSMVYNFYRWKGAFVSHQQRVTPGFVGKPAVSIAQGFVDFLYPSTHSLSFQSILPTNWDGYKVRPTHDPPKQLQTQTLESLTHPTNLRSGLRRAHAYSRSKNHSSRLRAMPKRSTAQYRDLSYIASASKKADEISRHLSTQS